jgi:hypothetical protein
MKMISNDSRISATPTASQAALRRVTRSRLGAAGDRDTGLVAFPVGEVRSLLGGVGSVVKVGPSWALLQPVARLTRFARLAIEIQAMAMIATHRRVPAIHSDAVTPSALT